MTASEFREKPIKNLRLAWEVYGYKIPDQELKSFTTKELETILLIEEGDTKETIEVILRERKDQM